MNPRINNNFQLHVNSEERFHSYGTSPNNQNQHERAQLIPINVQDAPTNSAHNNHNRSRISIRSLLNSSPTKSNMDSSKSNSTILIPEQTKNLKQTPSPSPCLSQDESSTKNIDTNDSILLNKLAVSFCNQGKYEAAEPFFLRALEEMRKSFDEDHIYIGMIENNIGSMYRTQEKYESATPHFQRALTILENQPRSDQAEIAKTMSLLALSLGKQKKFAEAELLFHRSLAILNKSFGHGYPDIFRILNDFAVMYSAEGKHAKAEKLFMYLLESMEKSGQTNHPYKKMILENFLIHQENQPNA